MHVYVICPSCNEENYGSALYCRKCQTSLIGIPRQRTPDSEIESDSLQATLEDRPLEVKPATIYGYSHMLGQIRSWGLSSLVLGAIHLFTSDFLSAPWGILLILVGLASFYFRSASMFIIYAITLAWAALSNLISLDVGWILFALLQFYLAYRVFRQYQRFHSVEVELNADTTDFTAEARSDSKRASRLFPWLGSIFGCSSIIAYVLITLAIIVIVIESDGKGIIPDYFGFIENLQLNFGVLGAAIGVASLLSKYRLKGLAILGIVGGIITILIEFALAYLS